MRVANPDDIKKAEAALVEAISRNFDPRVIREIFKKVHNLDIGENIQCKSAAIGVHDGDVAYSMDFEVAVNFSVLLDRAGNFISAAGSDVGPNEILEKKSPEAFFSQEADVKFSGVEDSMPEWEKNLQDAADETDVATSGGSYEDALKEFTSMDPDTGEKNG